MEKPPRSRQRPGMERPYAVLHKNLTEIESRLRQLSAANNDGASSYSPHQHQTVCKDVAAKIDFLKALLAAEMEAHASDTAPPPKHIFHLLHRLSAAEHALREREDGLDGLPPDDPHDVSMCSCTHECFDEPQPDTEAGEEEEEEEDVDGVPEPEDFGPLEDEKAESLASPWNSSVGEDEETEHGWHFGCRFDSAAVALASAAAIGVWDDEITKEEDLAGNKATTTDRMLQNVCDDAVRPFSGTGFADQSRGMVWISLHSVVLMVYISYYDKTAKSNSICFAGSLSEWKGILIRHCGFILDMMTLLTALGHYFVIWWLHGLAFHLVDVVLFLNMRALISAIAKRIRTYLKLRKALTSLDGALPDATYEELRAFDDECAICRKVAGTNGEGQKTVMQSSIPSRVFEILLNLEKHSHTFVKAQLDQGLTDVYSCPTCRRPLFTSNVQGGIRSASGNAIDGQQVAEHLNLGLNQQRVPGHAPLGASPNPSQNTSDTIWRGAAFDSSLTPTWMNQGIDGASSSSSVTSVGFGGVQMMMRQLASVSENFAQGSLHDSAWNLWLPQHTAIPHIPPSSSTRLNRNAAGLRIRNTTSPVNSNMSELLTMVDRVREVLPHVPDELIVQDLLRTNNINITVNNLLVQ
ncbi:hypothetical protein ZIOFF_061297 [Zingiber officinale]|uniref:CUE domain-containing protein n=1 Tax=Zingiber officinale TaxID=94328 RepID=A0A8J5K857_ZINOF|nr:hypothetical protein ZIOFF_061297 [Zingiber officinale]